MKAEIYRTFAYAGYDEGRVIIDAMLVAKWPDLTLEAWESSRVLSGLTIEGLLKKMGYKDCLRQLTGKIAMDVRAEVVGLDRFTFTSSHHPSMQEIEAAIYAKCMGETVASIHYEVDESIPDVTDTK